MAGSWRRQKRPTIEALVLHYLPDLAVAFSLHPWDIERLTWQQWSIYRAWLDERPKGD